MSVRSSNATAAAGRPPRLLIDVGNTRLKWAWSVAGAGTLPTPWQQDGAVAHGETAALAELAGRWRTLAGAGPAPEVWASNVAGPAIAGEVDALVDAAFGAAASVRWVRAEPRHDGLVNGYREPARLGVDRWVGCIGARCWQPDGTLLIVTAGTATTLDVVSAAPASVGAAAQAVRGRFEGGLILPGLELMLSSLARNTAQLPALEVSEAESAPPWADNTHDAIAAGCLAAQAGAVERTWRVLQARGPTRCLLSGGARHVLARALSMPFEMHDNLVLLGLHTMAGHRPAAR
ncbi:pantothenate kinase [Cupriavidus sp. USMAA2-4]|uniref:Type III pantothenate kinase n=1 Tax=Cupriavidus malaysiensis TaxID=367825 RepID=A0ABN4TJ86_9BURK|nr:MULTISPECIES: type III pantothenate kinase [Cupriavidus]AOY92065.1 pantothenate kinase [Cupriavidus sp. USMAA2-4]AOY98374.1 pantothenate kinase [Cupriavidus sp. USMAHM13]AOZ04806.1 pantothenate kinase [Cupriavidus malaysiensis]